MYITEYVVAINDRRGPELFRLIYAAGTVQGVESVRRVVGEALRKLDVPVEDGFVVFDNTWPRYDALRQAVRWDPVTLNGILPDDPVFAEGIRTILSDKDFQLGSSIES